MPRWWIPIKIRRLNTQYALTYRQNAATAMYGGRAPLNNGFVRAHVRRVDTVALIRPGPPTNCHGAIRFHALALALFLTSIPRRLDRRPGKIPSKRRCLTVYFFFNVSVKTVFDDVIFHAQWKYIR